jgi:methylated-DNA-[protein]-cysteine S-methyltransferase
METYFKTIYPSPVGNLTLVASSTALVALLWENDSPSRVKLPGDLIGAENEILHQTKSQLDEYFEGKRRVFNLPLQLEGTDFQKKVWTELTQIPFGHTRTYGQLAKRIDQESASRAVGAANGKNPIGIIVPCHRVTGPDLKLTGFAGGLEAKKKLLELEGHLFIF